MGVMVKVLTCPVTVITDVTGVGVQVDVELGVNVEGSGMKEVECVVGEDDGVGSEDEEEEGA